MHAHYHTIIIGGGHAGIEAAWAAANLGRDVALVTLDPSKIGVMSCNPAIGGLAKGQMVREIDALGGLMARATDATGIMFKVLNTSKGAAVQSPRAQCDKHAYARETQRLLGTRANIAIIEGSVERFVLAQAAQNPDRQGGATLAAAAQPSPSLTVGVPSVGPRIVGVTIATPTGERTLHAPAVVLTTGTFMRGLMHTGESQTVGGRIGEAAAVGISGTLRDLGFELGRLKTGTPPRLKRGTIDWDSLEPQLGDNPPTPFSDLTGAHPLDASMPRCLDAFPALTQVDCRVTNTTPEIHELIRANLHRAPMYSGQIESVGPRYCPSIEDKVVRFAQRESHHVFLEPESHESDWVYCNGISTSLPRDVQDTIVRSMKGCEKAEILQNGYAVEYDMVRPHQISATAMTKLVDGLFLAGQINGTSGYEEAAGQGLIAGLNAARYSLGLPLVTIGRDEAYFGVMMDDLVTKTPVEPYRMFTSRAEHRLILRSDNSADRLTPMGRELGLVDHERWGVFEQRAEALRRVNERIDTARTPEGPLAEVLKKPEFTVERLGKCLGAFPTPVLVTALAERQYAGYIKRQQSLVKKLRENERRRIPAKIDYANITGLRNEAREALQRFRPETFGQAGRLEGISPADLTLLLVAVGV
ncbi:MAG: tRNA uridine-5-carboxymethylaminomethyl(34) synthesis enzyme MnmG [Phycisphaerales bacterium]